jgi:small subunit ribosomal protein S9
MVQRFPISATGRRKSSIAQIELIDGNDRFIVNGQDVSEYMQQDVYCLSCIEAPLNVVTLTKECDIIAKVKGGGLVGQAQAIQLALARALSTFTQTARKSLKEKGLLTRDSRVKERRKYGLKKARKAPQFSKR